MVPCVVALLGVSMYEGEGGGNVRLLLNASLSLCWGFCCSSQGESGMLGLEVARREGGRRSDLLILELVTLRRWSVNIGQLRGKDRDENVFEIPLGVR